MEDKTSAFIKKCSKADLIWILEKVRRLGGGFAVEQSVISLEEKKTLERLKKCDELNKEAAECRKKYISLLQPYAGKCLSEIPRNVLQKAASEIDRAQELDKQWNKLMKMC